MRPYLLGDRAPISEDAITFSYDQLTKEGIYVKQSCSGHKTFCLLIAGFTHIIKFQTLHVSRALVPCGRVFCLIYIYIQSVYRNLKIGEQNCIFINRIHAERPGSDRSYFCAKDVQTYIGIYNEIFGGNHLYVARP